MSIKMEKVPNKWVEAAEQLAKDAGALVTCPSCGKATLVTRDERVWESKRIERVFECKVCGKHGSVLIADENDSNEQHAQKLPNSMPEDSNDVGDQTSIAIEAVRSMKKRK